MSKKEELAVSERTIVDGVLTKITNFKETGELVLPKDYSPENALKSAYLILTEAVMKDKTTPVLKGCTSVSIANSLLDMVVQGLSPMKNQCYFIPYGNKLELSRSYLGSIALAKRSGMKTIVANVVYNDDVFNYEIEPNTGYVKILEHSQKLENIDIGKIRGAYAITTMEDGTSNVTVMTITQIKTAWLQGYAKGQSGAHTNFTDEMCKKTVINRACKIIINGSTDVFLTKEEDTENNNDDIKPITDTEANVQEIQIVEPETVTPKEPVKKESKVKAEF